MINRRKYISTSTERPDTEATRRAIPDPLYACAAQRLDTPAEACASLRVSGVQYQCTVQTPRTHFPYYWPTVYPSQATPARYTWVKWGPPMTANQPDPDPAQAWRANADRLARWYAANLSSPSISFAHSGCDELMLFIPLFSATCRLGSHPGNAVSCLGVRLSSI